MAVKNLILETLRGANKSPIPVLKLAEPMVSGRGRLDLNFSMCLTRAACWVSICRRLVLQDMGGWEGMRVVVCFFSSPGLRSTEHSEGPSD